MNVSEECERVKEESILHRGITSNDHILHECSWTFGIMTLVKADSWAKKSAKHHESTWNQQHLGSTDSSATEKLLLSMQVCFQLSGVVLWKQGNPKSKVIYHFM